MLFFYTLELPLCRSTSQRSYLSNSTKDEQLVGASGGQSNHSLTSPDASNIFTCLRNTTVVAKAVRRVQQSIIEMTLQQHIIAALQTRLCTWDELKEATKSNDERLGFAIGELLSQRKIWTAHHQQVRLYGLERRVGLVPRFSPERRRATDFT